MNLRKVAITGCNGTTGKPLIKGLDPSRFDLTPLDLPDFDARDLLAFASALNGHNAVVHLAWANMARDFGTKHIDPDNFTMTLNCYQAALDAGVKRVIMASSHHANRRDNTDEQGQITPKVMPPIPTNPYGATKVFAESLGRYFATQGLEVICVRIGNVNEPDTPQACSAEYPQRWLSHRDWVSLVESCVEAGHVPGNFEIMYGVSRSSENLFSWSNSFGWEPLDSAD